MITKEALVEMFDDMQNNTSWDLLAHSYGVISLPILPNRN